MTTLWTEARAKFVLYPPFAYYFVGPSAFVAYLAAFARPAWPTARHAALIVGLAVLLAYQLLVAGWAALYPMRYFWGWILFLLYFQTHPLGSRHAPLFRGVLLALCGYTLIEAVAVNTFLDPTLLPNFADRTPGFGGQSHLGGIYQRPYSFGANATVTSTLLVVMGLMVPLRVWQRAFLAVTVVVVGSATGILLFALATAITYRHDVRGQVTLGIVTLLGLVYLLFVPEGYLGREKLAWEHLMVIASAKFDTLLAVDRGFLGALFGVIPGRDEYGGDFAINTLSVSFGLFGVALLLTFAAYHSRRATRLPIAIMLLGILHYGALFSLPGQAIFGLLLAGAFGEDASARASPSETGAGSPHGDADPVS